MGETEPQINEERDHTAGLRLNAEKTTIFPYLIYRLNTVPVKIAKVITELDKNRSLIL